MWWDGKRVSGGERGETFGYDSGVLFWIAAAFWLGQASGDLFEAAREGDAAKLQSLLSGTLKVNQRDSRGRTALHEAAGGCHVDAARLLVQAGWDKLARDEKGWTPAMYALQCRDANVKGVLSRLLMVAPAARERDPWSMQNAAAHGSISVLEMLLRMGVDVNAVGPDGHRALDIACLKGDATVAKLLLEHGANPALRNDSGATPLHDAALSGNGKVVELLLAHGAEVNAVDPKSGSTPLHYAASFGRLDAVKILVGHGADASRKNAEGLTAAELAVRSGQAEVAKALGKSPERN
jgi:ankyrin repeat protein